MSGCFPFMPVPARPAKPRQTGITLMTDRGLSCRNSEDIMEVAGDIVDRVKFNDHSGVLARYPKEWFARKFEIYRKYGVITMTGGIPFELAVLQGKIEPFFDRMKELGFDSVEISEDVIPAMEKSAREAAIRRAMAAGLKVVTELGRKVPDKPIDVDWAASMALADLELGVSIVTLEHSELRLFHDGDPEPLFKLVEMVGMKNLMFEPNPGGWPWLHTWLVKNLGPEVNLGNVYPEELFILEGMRRGMTRAVNYPFLTEQEGKL